MTKVSLIVPIYNVEKYLERCIKSIQNQTLKDIEIILIDDGSPDNCPKICDKFAAKDDRVKVIHKVNKGLGYARNSGIEIACGEYIAFVDSDDYIEKDMCEILYNTAVKENADIVFCNHYNDCINKIINHIDLEKTTEFNDSEVINFALDFIAMPPKHHIERVYTMSVWHAIYKTNLIKENNIKFQSERIVLSEDLPFQTEIIQLCKKIIYRPECLYHYNNTNISSLTSNFKISKIDNCTNLYNSLCKLTEKIDPESIRSKRFILSYFRRFSIDISNLKMPVKERLKMLRHIVNQEIWKELSTFPASFLPFKYRIFYLLQKNKLVWLNFLAGKLIKILNRINIIKLK